MSTSRHLLVALALGLALITAACGSSVPAAGSPGAADAPAVTAAASAPATSIADSTLAPAPTAVATASTADAALDCSAPATPTIAQTEGPYYMPGAPESANLTADSMPGTRLTLTGYVADTSCAPVANAKVETWQADATGAYDNAGFSLRGWVTTDAAGRFTIGTVVPGEYPGRTEHIHVKVTPPGGATLTTQVYFPGSTANGEDGIYDPSLDLVVTQDGDALVATYTFVLGS
jgi:protocatechuate 3,4-dioxygenase beta subunit